MDSPTQLSDSNPTILHKEIEDWDCTTFENLNICLYQYSSVLNKNGVAYLIFTSGGSDDKTNTSIGYIKISSGKDPLNASRWKWHSGPVLTTNVEEDVGNICCSSLTTSPYGTETWMMYHASTDVQLSYRKRTPRLEKIAWNEETEEPEFPLAHGLNHPQPVPSGQKMEIWKQLRLPHQCAQF